MTCHSAKVEIAENPKLSVCIITFNHAEFIAKALDSVLTQQTSFEYNVIIGDDCSTDGTDKIIEMYQRRWPDKFSPLCREKNVGMGKNLKETLERCSGEYVAFLEGDDYWTDPRKLQAQVDHLDNNPGCALCHHRVDYISWPGGEKLKEFPPRRFRVDRPDPRTLAMCNFIQTCSVVCRRKWLPLFDEELEELKLADWPLFVLLSERGWIGYLDRTMAHYRVHANNSWKARPIDYQMRGLERMARYLLERVDDRSKDSWKDMILTLAFKEVVLALQSFAFGRSVGKLKRFIKRSVEFKKPFWTFNRLWPHYRANNCK
ncbi:MAG TPA: glycosyltransferase [Verrucomicrobiae bacterium]|nr:glycosyltransferase [Verrucomicrobiae bacterium]